eukprot:6481391-Amphidinium_carterae.1
MFCSSLAIGFCSLFGRWTRHCGCRPSRSLGCSRATRTERVRYDKGFGCVLVLGMYGCGVPFPLVPHFSCRLVSSRTTSGSPSLDICTKTASSMEAH